LYIQNHPQMDIQYNTVEQYEMNNLSDDISTSSSIISEELSDKLDRPRPKGFLYQFIIEPFISFASNPHLFYPYHLFYIYYLIGPQLVGNLMDKGKTFKERFVIIFMHGVYANGEKVNYTDGYFYLFEELLIQQTVFFLLIVYLNHCKCRQFIVTIIVYMFVIYKCITAILSRKFSCYHPIQLLLSPFYIWFMVWEIGVIIILLIRNFIKYPSSYGKFFKQK